MVFPTIISPKVTTGTTFGGDVMNKVMQWFSGVNIAATDTTNKPSISTETRFYSGKFILYDYDFTNELKFFTPPLANNVSISFPDALSSVGLNELTFNLVTQELKNKTINASLNVITNLADANFSATANIAWSKVSKVGSGLSDIATVDLTGLANDVSLKWNAATGKWVVYALGSLVGEVNTMSNLTGTAGAVGVFKQKAGVNFEMKKLNAKTTSVTITDDTANNEVDIGVADATTSLKGAVQLASDGGTTASTAVQATDSRLTNSRTPTAHATSHKTGQSDVIKLNELGAPTTNVTALNSTTSANGLFPMLNGLSNYYPDGTGGWSIPASASGLLDTGTLVRGVSTASGNGSTKVFNIAHGYSGTPVSYLVNATSTDAFGFFAITVNSTNITLTYTVAPPTGTNNLSWSWLVMSSGTGSAAGEANTTSTVGTGAAWTKTKVGANLPFKSFLAGSTKIGLTDNTNDITIDVNQANLSIAYSQLTSIPSAVVRSDQVNTYGAFLQTFPSSTVKILNPAGTFGYTVAGDAITANRILTVPPLTADDTLIVAALAQTLTNKTLTAPIINLIKNGSFNFTVPTLTANDQIVGRNTTDTLTNKTLTNPIIASIVNTGTLTLPTSTDTIVGRATSDTMTNKTIRPADNTITDTAAATGALLVHNGTKYVTQTKGADGTFLGVSGGALGYFTPPTGSGGSLPDGSSIPTTGRWGALWGGSLTGVGMFSITPTYNTVTSTIQSPTETTTDIATPATDDSIAELKTLTIFSRQSNIVFRAKWALKQTTNTVIMVGLSSLATLPTGGNHDDPLDSASGVMLTCAHDVETVYQVSRNNGAAAQTKVATSVAANTTATHTCEINLNTTNCVVTLDGTVVGTYTTLIPALTTPLMAAIHIEAIGGTSKAVAVYRMQATCL